jgi:hypothetical protein
VGIGSYQRIRESGPSAIPFFREYNACEVFKIHLMADTRVRRDDPEIPKALLTPAKEGVALDIALHFEFGVETECIARAEFVDLHGMIDHKLGRKHRVDLFRIATEFLDRVAHGCEIDHSRYARKILQQDSRG